MTSKSGSSPAFNAVVFQRLTEDLESFDVAYDFTLSFQALLPGRIQRIDHALKTKNREEILVALLSLQASAAMVGATQLEASATHALAHEPVEKTLPGPLKRKLEGQADMFRQAFTRLHDTQTNSSARKDPHHKTG